MTETREFKRHRKRLKLKFGKELPTQVAFSEDLSLHGLCIKTAMVWPPSSSLEIEVSLPDGNVTRLTGVVMWAKKVPSNMIHLVKKCGMGVKINRIISGEEAYRRFCDDQLER
jgi:hypothetical protein